MLKTHGHSLTSTRQSVLSAFNDHEPLTMTQLVARIPQVDRASVYRTVALFESLGILNRLTQGWKYQLELSDLFGHHHHHVTCTSCGQVVTTAEPAELEAIITQLAAEVGFTSISHSLELTGICQSCQ